MSQLFDESQQFIDEATGELLVGGLLYIGENGLDSKLNPITIYPDRELAGTPLANPQTIGADGRAENKIWVAGKYSFKVENSANVQKYNELENGFDEQVGNTLLINALGVNDVVVNGSPTVTTLIDSQTYVFTAPADNTGAMTLKIDGTAVMPLKIRHDQALASGDIKQDQKIVVVANLTDSIYEVINDLSGVTLNGAETLTNKEIDGASYTGTQTGFTGDVAGNADTATAWSSSRTVTITGDVAGSDSSPNGQPTINVSLGTGVVDKTNIGAGAVGFNSEILVDGTDTSNTVSSASPYGLDKGIYYLYSSDVNESIEANVNGSWRKVIDLTSQPKLIVSDGANVRIVSTDAGTTTLYFRQLY